MTLHEKRLSMQPFREPAPACATKDCQYPVRTDLELKLCEGCGKRFCGDCVRELGGLPFCVTCAVCKECRKAGADICAACGDVCCAAHLKWAHSREQGRDHEDLVCRNGCDCGPAEAVALAKEEPCPW